jgi:hypothetical protein
MDRANETAGDARAEALLADARRHVDERLARLERELTEERVKIASQLASAGRELETIAQQPTSKGRITAEQLGRRLPEKSLFR